MNISLSKIIGFRRALSALKGADEEMTHLVNIALEAIPDPDNIYIKTEVQTDSCCTNCLLIQRQAF